MAGCKAGPLVFLKSLISDAGPDKENEFLGLLNEEEKKLWEKLSAFQWIPMEVTNKFLIYGSKVLSQNKSQDKILYEVGIGAAKHDINKVYSMIFKLIRPGTIITKAAGMWKTHHQAGECSVEILLEAGGKYKVLYDLKNYPDFPEEFAQATSGYVHGLLEIANAKNIKIVKQRHGTGWRWHITFEWGRI